MTQTTQPATGPEAAGPRPGAQDQPQQPRGVSDRLPEIPGPWQTAVMVWRVLRRMSTALLLLFALAAVSIVATFVPQEPVIPTTVADWRAGVAGPGSPVAAVLDALQLFDVFGSWWFAGLVLLLFTSLTGCLIPRYRAFAKVVRRPPAAGRNLHRLTHRAELVTAVGPAAALDAAEAVLRRRRYRRRRVAPDDTASGRPQLAAERGHGREGGSLLFHTSFFVLLIGAVIGQAFGFVGQVNVVEGAAFADTRINYGLATPGRFFGLGDHRGFVVTLDDFTVDWFENNTPSEFVSTITIRDPDGSEVTRQTRVNHPVAHDGMKIFQARFGWAPRLVVRSGDTVLFDDTVNLLEASPWIWTGVAKVAATDRTNQIALELVLLPDAGFAADGRPVSRSPRPDNVRMAAVLWFGELGLERPVPASQFDREAGRQLGAPAILAVGETGDLAEGNLSVEFAELRNWSGFQVSHAPGRSVLLLAGVLLLTGLVPSLYAYRRRIWIEAQPAGAAGSEHDPVAGAHPPTRLVVAGVALHRKHRFEEEFAEVEQALAGALPPPDDRSDDRPDDRPSEDPR
jgi:cytochrome c biogenesis protein